MASSISIANVLFCSTGQVKQFGTDGTPGTPDPGIRPLTGLHFAADFRLTDRLNNHAGNRSGVGLSWKLNAFGIEVGKLDSHENSKIISTLIWK